MQNDGLELKRGSEVGRKLLQHSFKEHDMTQLIGRSRLDVFDEVSAEILASLVQEEPPQIQALILAHIDARKSFETLEALPAKLRSQILLRISKLEAITSEQLDELNKRLKETMKKHGGE